jgi:anti-sigma regulatory factor (Ser/Thr protein kinase)
MSHQGDAVPSPANPVLRRPDRALPGAGGAASPGGLLPAPRPADADETPARRPVLAGHDVPDTAVLRVRRSAEGFAQVRTFTRSTLSRWSLDHRSDDAALVITELAANAVAHAPPRTTGGEAEVWLGILLHPAHLLITVSDSGEAPPRVTAAEDSVLPEHGRGLCIVDALAEEWGWTPNPPIGKTVWARLSTCPPS